MSCERNPHPFELFSHPGDLYEDARDRLLALLSAHDLEQITLELRDWANLQGISFVAAWVRRLFRELISQEDSRKAARLLECFGKAFRGDEVGHLGRDLLIAPLHSSHYEIRTTAITVLGYWLEHDPEGPWAEMLQDRLQQEWNSILRSRCESLLSWFSA